MKDNYFVNLNENFKSYFNILCEDFPDFIIEYVNTIEMLRLNKISTQCGIIYSKSMDRKWYSTLDHSVAVALIVWNFTHDKVKTLSALFHDIVTPVFKHSIEFMYNDSCKQEVSEKYISKFISSSDEIMAKLKRDNINLEDIDDYHLYPIAGNDIPKLSADRLEYTLINSLGVNMNLLTLSEVKEIYDDIIVLENEDEEPELGFKTKEMAEKFVSVMSTLSKSYNSPVAKFSMQYLSDVVLTMIKDNLITNEELYKITDEEMIEKIKKCEVHNISKSFEIWQKSEEMYESDTFITDKYNVSVSPKVRYIDPLVMNLGRISKVSSSAAYDIEDAKNYKTKKYIYSNFYF